MKVLIISDTNYKNEEMEQSIYDLILNSDFLIHAGDFSSKKAYDSFKILCDEKNIPFKAVYGNNDPDSLREILPERDVFETDGIKIGLIHIAGRSLNENTARWYLLREMEVDVLIHGHIHTPMVDRYEDKYIICPGSPTRPRLSDKSVIMMETEGGKVKSVEQIKVGDSMCSSAMFKKYLEEKEMRREKNEK